MSSACLYADATGRRLRAARETGPETLREQEIELIQRWRGTFVAEGTWPGTGEAEAISTPPGAYTRRTRMRPPTTVATTATPPSPRRPPLWFVAALVGCIAWLASLYLVTR